MESQSTMETCLAQSSALSCMMVKGMIPPQEIAALLDGAGVSFVLAGAHALSAWTRRPRATIDVDLVVAAPDHEKAVAALRAAYPALRVRDTQVVTRFLSPESGEALIDLMKPTSAIIRAVFDHSASVPIGGRPLRIPDLEMAAVMKFAAMIGINRKRADKVQDGADFMRLIEANPGVDLAKLERLAELVYQGGAAEIRRLVEAIRKGDPLVF